MQRNTYRYIRDRNAFGTTPLSELQLFAAPRMQNAIPDGEDLAVLRIVLRDDIETVPTRDGEKTNDRRSLREIGYEMFVWDVLKSKWLVRNELKGIPLRHIHEVVKPGTMESVLQMPRHFRESYIARGFDYFGVRSPGNLRDKTNGQINALVLRLQSLYQAEEPAQYADNKIIR